jgi:hypothetical protein
LGKCAQLLIEGVGGGQCALGIGKCAQMLREGVGGRQVLRDKSGVQNCCRAIILGPVDGPI